MPSRPSSHHLTALAAVLIALLVGLAAAIAGPLTPPAGPVAPTPGPEPRIAINDTNTPGDADSIFKITQPGSYYLTGNITGVAGKHGIEITSSGVSLDLNGFDLLGVSGSLDGVWLATAANGSAIRNGTVRNWGGSGLNLFGSNDTFVSGIRAIGNGSYGIRGSNRTVLRNCVADANAGPGLRVTSGGIIDGCVASYNGEDGIQVGNSSFITANSSIFNGTGANGGAGIHATSSDNRIEGNNCIGNDRGIDVDAVGNFIVRNTCSGNTTANWDIVANNVYGPILDRSTPASAPVTGNIGPGSLGSADPNANFTY